MAVYSINDLEQLTGIKAHTLRIWEKRYGLIEPKRTEANIRFYQDEDLKRLLNIALLNRNGCKISQIASMSQREILEKVAELTELDICNKGQIDALTLSMIELDEQKFNRIIDKHIEEKGFEETLFTVVFPLLEKVGNMWMSGSLKRVHEYFLTFMIQRKIVAAIEMGRDRGEDCKGRRVLLFLPEDSLHGLSFILAHLLLRNRRFDVVNIGSNILPQDILDAANLCKPDFLFTFHTGRSPNADVQAYLKSLVHHGIEQPIIVAGVPGRMQGVDSKDNIVYLGSLEETMAYLEKEAL